MLDESATPLDVQQVRVLRPLAPWTWISAFLRIRRSQPDIVLVQWWHVFFAPCLLSVIVMCRVLLRLPVVVLCHNVCDHEDHPTVNGIGTWLLARSGATFIVHSPADAATLSASRPKVKILVTQHPTYEVFLGANPPEKSTARRALGIPPDARLCLFFGIVRKYKGLEDLLEAMALVKCDPAPRLFIAGEFYEPVSRFEEQIQRLGIHDRVHVRNEYIPNENVEAIFRAADLLVVPYRSASQSGVVRIANAFALPVIVTNVGGLPEMIEAERTGLIVPPGSPPELADAVSRFFEENLADRFAPALEAQSGRFPWDALAGHLETLAAGNGEPARVGESRRRYLHSAGGKAPRVVLTGSFHSGNRGDASMQWTAVTEIRRRRPSAAITLMSTDPAADAPIYPGVNLVRTQRRRPIRAATQVLAAFLRRFLWLPDTLLDGELREIAAADVVVDLSGDGFTETFGWKCPASHAVPLLLSRILGIPCVPVAQTIGPFRHARRFYRWLFSGTAAVSCRDAESVENLKVLGVAGPQIHLTADAAFLLEPAPTGILPETYPWLEGANARKPFIGVTPSNLHNVRGASGAAGTADDCVLRSLANAAERLAELTGGTVLIIPTVFGPGDGYDDRRSATALYAMLRDPARAHVCDHPLAPGGLKSLIGLCDIYVGVRMHGIIAALSQGIPSLAIAYGSKTENLFRRFGVERHAVSIAEISPDLLAGMAERLWAERDAVRRQLHSALAADIIPAAQASFALFDEFLCPPATPGE
jgi:polysaccharide pyruvyl transferase WcaK-like protein/glycosyltransferase involved in cell wall biosynthesis